MTGYRAALRRLTALDDETARLRAEADRWYADRQAALAEAERAADEEVARTAAEVDRARRTVEDVDARAAGLWSEFVHRVGPTAERFGRTVPAPVTPRQRGDRRAEEYLRDVAARLAYVPPARPVTNSLQVLLGLIGAVGGAVGFLVGFGVRAIGHRAGGDWAVGLPVLALLLTLFGPLAAVAAAKRIADRRGVGLDAATVAVVLGPGLAVIGAAYALLR